jgi:hypothetical protein
MCEPQSSIQVLSLQWCSTFGSSAERSPMAAVWELRHWVPGGFDELQLSRAAMFVASMTINMVTTVCSSTAANPAVLTSNDGPD